MKTLAIALSATFLIVQVSPAISSPMEPSTYDASHAKCKKGEKMDVKTKKCVKVKS